MKNYIPVFELFLNQKHPIFSLFYVDDPKNSVSCQISFEDILFANQIIREADEDLLSWFPHLDDMEAIAKIIKIIKLYKLHKTPWWKTVLTHAKHLVFKFHHFDRWNRTKFSRCEICNGKFDPDEVPLTFDHDDVKKKWGFIGAESNLYHGSCLDNNGL